MKLKEILVGQLKQGASPRALALGVAVAFTWGLFPILGTTTALCLASGHLLKLNHPTLQAVNYLLAPVQVLMIPVWVRLGELLLGRPPIALSPSGLTAEFHAGPALFFEHYGEALLHGTLAWLCVAPLAGLVVYSVLKRVFGRIRPQAAAS